MNKGGPIIIIEDDLDDQDILTEIFQELNYKNEVIFFKEGEKALEYLKSTGLGDTAFYHRTFYNLL